MLTFPPAVNLIVSHWIEASMNDCNFYLHLLYLNSLLAVSLVGIQACLSYSHIPSCSASAYICQLCS